MTNNTKAKRVLILFADGFEETEAITPWDILKRAGAEVITVSVSGKNEVAGAHGLKVIADMPVSEALCLDFDMLFLPGGMPGTLNLSGSEDTEKLLRKADEKKRFICAICAAPSVLGRYSLLDGKKATCYPGYENKLGNARYVHAKTVRDGNIITGCGMGAACEFGFALAEALYGTEAAGSIMESTCYNF